MLGAGDAFSAGLPVRLGARRDLRRLLHATPMPAARSSCRGTAARRRCPRGSSSITISPTRKRIPRPDRDEELRRLHRKTAPRTPRPELFLFAFDHRDQFFELARAHGRRREPHSGAEEALRRSRRADGSGARPRRARRSSVRRSLRPGRAQRRDRPRLVGRATRRAAGVESGRVRGGRSIGTALIAWPVEQVVKCLVPFHPDDEVGNRLENEAQVKALYDAVQASGHELLIEIVPPKRLPAEPDVLLRAMKRLYNLGIYPEWWKLPPPSAAEWPAHRRADRRARSVLSRCRAAGLERADRRAGARLRRRRRKPHCAAALPSGARSSTIRRARGSPARSTTPVSSPGCGRISKR